MGYSSQAFNLSIYGYFFMNTFSILKNPNHTLCIIESIKKMQSFSTFYKLRFVYVICILY